MKDTSGFTELGSTHARLVLSRLPKIFLSSEVMIRRVFNGRGRPSNNEDYGYDSVAEIAEQRARNRGAPAAA